MVHSYHEIWLRNKECTTDMNHNLDKSPRNYAKWKKSIPKVIWVQLHDCIYTAFLKWQNYRNWEQIIGCQRSRLRTREGCECAHKRTTGGVLVGIVGMELLCISIVSTWTPWLCYCTILFQDNVTVRNWVKNIRDLQLSKI